MARRLRPQGRLGAGAVLAGAIYGAVRQSIAVALAVGGGYDWIMATYERLRPTARALDVTGLVVGSVTLVALSAA